MSSDDSVFDVAAERERLLAKRAAAARRQHKRRRVALRTAVDAIGDAPADAELRSVRAALDDLLKAQPALRGCALRDEARRVFGTAQRYSIVYADPPWAYRDTANRNSAAAQYPTMTPDELAALPVSGLAYTDAALLMWATTPLLDVAIRLMRDWGFEYKQVFATWVKCAGYMAQPIYRGGAYTQTNAELLLLGVRGRLHVRRRADFCTGSVLLARPREHSRKPERTRSMIKAVFGDLRAIELFARASADDASWDTWGNDTARFDAERAGANPNPVRAGRRRANNLSAVVRRGATRSAVTRDRGPRSALAFYNRPTTAMFMNKAAADIDGEPLAIADDAPEASGLRQLTILELLGDRLAVVRRHRIYARHSVAEAARAAEVICAQQQYNSDVLFAVNNNTGRAKKARVRYSVRALDVIGAAKSE